jgi:hypothetical protein
LSEWGILPKWPLSRGGLRLVRFGQIGTNVRFCDRYRGRSGHGVALANRSFLTHSVISSPSIDALRKVDLPLFGHGVFLVFSAAGAASVAGGAEAWPDHSITGSERGDFVSQKAS